MYRFSRPHWLNRSRARGTWRRRLPRHRDIRLVLVGVALSALSACAAGPDPRDPMEPFNRKVMQFNERVDAVVLKPAATVYKDATPPRVRTGVGNFFGNLGEAWSFANSALQFRFKNAGETFMRLSVNTFFGLGGILDVASGLNIERHREDFGQTLGHWGVPEGPYMVLPLLGPSTLRDTLALTLDYKGDLLARVTPPTVRDALNGLRALDERANVLRLGTVIDEAALDKYSFVRDAYLQKRRAEIFDSKDDTDGAVPTLP
jgi:phospholipid-binding lipoprotein MlaA